MNRTGRRTSEPSDSRERIVVVEDDFDTRQALGIRLEACGYFVAYAGDAESALYLIRAFRPNTVILDLGLPKGDGLSVMRTLRSELGEPPCFIILSAWDETRYEELALDEGAAIYLQKPASAEDLMEALDLVAPQGVC